MRLTCPCGLHGSIELFTEDEHARKFAVLVASLPGGAGAVAVRYIGLFRPGKRALAWDRACKLLEEVRDMLVAGVVERYGKTYPGTPSLFIAAMQQMLDQRERLDLPMKTHGYLVSIIAGESPKAAAAAEEAEEQRRRQVSSQRSSAIQRARNDLHGEEQVRLRLKMPAMTESEKAEFLRNKEREYASDNP
jgi:hypothetical protein